MIDYSKVLSKTVVDTPKSGIRKFFDLMNTMQDVVGLTVGEPDFQTPWHIREAGIESLERGKTYYTANAGLLALREEINNYLTRKFSISYDPANEVIVTVGGSEAIDLAFRAVLEPGDEVIVPEPSFVCYDPITRLAGGVPVALPTFAEDEFRINPAVLEEKITPKTKILMLPYPNNPTGAIMGEEHLKPIADICRRHDLIAGRRLQEAAVGQLFGIHIGAEDLGHRHIAGFRTAELRQQPLFPGDRRPDPLTKDMVHLTRQGEEPDFANAQDLLLPGITVLS